MPPEAHIKLLAMFVVDLLETQLRMFPLVSKPRGSVPGSFLIMDLVKPTWTWSAPPRSCSQRELVSLLPELGRVRGCSETSSCMCARGQLTRSRLLPVGLWQTGQNAARSTLGTPSLPCVGLSGTSHGARGQQVQPDQTCTERAAYLPRCWVSTQTSRVRHDAAQF